MKKVVKFLGISAGLLFLLLSIGAVSFTAFVDKRALLESQLSSWSGRKASLSGDLSVSLGFEPIIRVEKFSLSNAEWSKNPEMISASSIEIATNLRSLFSGKVEIKSVTLHEPKVLLERSSDGKANWIFDDSVPIQNEEVPNQAVDPSAHALGGVNLLSIKGGNLTYQNDEAKSDFHLSLKDFEATHLASDNSIALKADGALLDGMRLFARLTGTTRQGSEKDPGAFTLEAVYRSEGQKYSISNLTGILGADAVSGNINVDTRPDGRLFISGDANLNLLDVQGFFEGTGLPPAPVVEAAPAVKRTKTKAKAPKYFFSDHELSLGALSALDVDMQLKIKTLPLHNMMTVNDVEGHVNITDGVLTVKDTKGIFAEGGFKLDYSLNSAATPANYNVKFSADDLAYGAWLSQKKIAHGIVGRGDVFLELAGEGNSLHAMASSGSGNFSFKSENGEIRSKDLEVVALSLDDALPSLFKNKTERMPLHCLMARYNINKGIASAREALVHAGVITALGGGDVNFRNEQFLMSVHTRTDSASLSSFIPPVELSGSWFAPNVEWDATGSAAEVFDSLGSLIASPITLVANAIGDEKVKSKSACQRALDENAADIKSIRENKNFLRDSATGIRRAGESVSDGFGDVLGDIGKGIGSIF